MKKLILNVKMNKQENSSPSGRILEENGTTQEPVRNDDKKETKRQNLLLMLFTVNSGFLYLSRILCYGYFNGSIRMLEKQFGFTTTQTGFLTSVDNFLAIVVQVFGGYIGDKVHKTRLIGMCNLTACLSALLTVVPYFVFMDFDPLKLSLKNFENKTEKSVDVLCSPELNQTDNCREDPGKVVGLSNQVAFDIFAVARFILGFAGVSSNITMAYISNNAKPNKASWYIGINFYFSIYCWVFKNNKTTE